MFASRLALSAVICALAVFTAATGTADAARVNRSSPKKVSLKKVVKPRRVDKIQTRATRKAREGAAPKKVLEAVRTERKALEAAEQVAMHDATEIVSGWSQKKLLRFGFADRGKAAEEMKKRLFLRHDHRKLKSLRVAEQALKIEIALTKEHAKAVRKGKKKKARKLARKIRESRFVLEEVLIAGDLNKALGIEKALLRGIEDGFRKRVPLAGRVFSRFRRSRFDDPGLEDGVPDKAELYRKNRKKKRIRPERILRGPWWKPGKEPQIPGAETVMELKDLRNPQADGAHAAVFVTDPATGDEWKMKFFRRR